MRLFVAAAVVLQLAAGQAFGQNIAIIGAGGNSPVATTASFVGDLDTAPNGIQGWWGLEAASAALRGPTHYVIHVCEPAGSPCFDVGTDASTGQITPAIVSAATGANTACNNSTNICTIGVTGDSAFYDQSGNGYTQTVSTGALPMAFVTPGGCPASLSASLYCAATVAANNQYTSTTGATLTTCPCNLMATFIDTLGSNSFATGIGSDNGNFDIASVSGVMNFYAFAYYAATGSVYNTWYDVIGGTGASGFLKANALSSNITPTATSWTTEIPLMTYGGGGMTGFFFKAGLWQNNSTALAISSANAATMIANTRTRLGF